MEASCVSSWLLWFWLLQSKANVSIAQLKPGNSGAWMDRPEEEKECSGRLASGHGMAFTHMTHSSYGYLHKPI